MLLLEPLREEIEAAPATLRSDVRAPFGPALDDSAVPEQTHDLPIRRVFDQPNGGPAPIEPGDAQLAAEQPSKPRFVDIVVPDIGEARSAHGLMVIQVDGRSGSGSGASLPTAPISRQSGSFAQPSTCRYGFGKHLGRPPAPAVFLNDHDRTDHSLDTAVILTY